MTSLLRVIWSSSIKVIGHIKLNLVLRGLLCAYANTGGISSESQFIEDSISISDSQQYLLNLFSFWRAHLCFRDMKK